jgi:hypothetical protein
LNARYGQKLLIAACSSRLADQALSCEHPSLYTLTRLIKINYLSKSALGIALKACCSEDAYFKFDPIGIGYVE